MKDSVKSTAGSGAAEADGSSAPNPVDARAVVAYLTAPEGDQYIAIMDVLEASITDLAPDEIAARLMVVGLALDAATMQARLDKLRIWGAVSARTDAS